MTEPNTIHPEEDPTQQPPTGLPPWATSRPHPESLRPEDPVPGPIARPPRHPAVGVGLLLIVVMGLLVLGVVTMLT
jgi:hypothetical protein